MVLSALLLSAVLPAAPVLSSIEGLPAAEAGAIILAGREHGVVESVAPPATLALMPPGRVERILTERAVAQAEGCVRRRWTAVFRHRPDEPEGAAAFAEARPATEIARPAASGCPDRGFARLGGGIDVAEAFAALRHLDDVVRHRITVDFQCTDSTGTALCATPATIRRDLSGLSAWMVMRRGTGLELWLGEPGQVVTVISYAPARPGHMTVQRKLPSPA